MSSRVSAVRPSLQRPTNVTWYVEEASNLWDACGLPELSGFELWNREREVRNVSFDRDDVGCREHDRLDGISRVHRLGVDRC